MIFGPHELIPGPSTYITLLRQPVALAISQYRYVRRTPGHRLHDLLNSEGMTLTEYVRRGVSLEVDNSQTRAISGDVSTPFGGVTPEMLETAKRNIEQHFAVVGLTERFDESLILLRRAFGWSKLTYLRVKVAPKTQGNPVSPAATRFLEEQNRFDMELCEFAAKRFQEAIDADPSFERDLRRFQLANALHRPWGAITYTIPKRILSRVEP